MSTTLEKAIAFHHERGLDQRYDDVIEVEWSEGADLALIQASASYDYTNQKWTTADHAHCSTANEDLPLIFCGADRNACYGGTAS